MLTLEDIEMTTLYEHSRKVSQISGMLAKHAGFSPAEIKIIEQAAAFHDLGKCGLPMYVLQKNGALTQGEYEIIKTHTTIGASRIYEIIKVLIAAEYIAAGHHERCDGKGYPNGLTGDETHPLARLVGVVDVLDALLANRSYKQPWRLEDACRYIEQNSGKQFDSKYVRLLLEIIDRIAPLY